MIRICYLVYYNAECLGAIFREDLTSATRTLGLDLCSNPGCDYHQMDSRHTHLEDSAFGPPQLYPADDVKRAGLFFREGILPELGSIRWELYGESDVSPVIYFKKSKLVV